MSSGVNMHSLHTYECPRCCGWSSRWRPVTAVRVDFHSSHCDLIVNSGGMSSASLFIYILCIYFCNVRAWQGVIKYSCWCNVWYSLAPSWGWQFILASFESPQPPAADHSPWPTGRQRTRSRHLSLSKIMCLWNYIDANDRRQNLFCWLWFVAMSNTYHW